MCGGKWRFCGDGSNYMIEVFIESYGFRSYADSARRDPPL